MLSGVGVVDLVSVPSRAIACSDPPPEENKRAGAVALVERDPFVGTGSWGSVRPCLVCRCDESDTCVRVELGQEKEWGITAPVLVGGASDGVVCAMRNLSREIQAKHAGCGGSGSA